MERPSQTPEVVPGGTSEAPSDAIGRRGRLGAGLIGLGILCLVWGALHMADASLAGSGRTFEQRQSYDAVKGHAREAFLGTLARAAVGALLIGVGARLRRSSGSKAE